MGSSYNTETCEDVDLAGCMSDRVGGRYTDPCSCKGFFTCDSNRRMVYEACNAGTYWDYTIKICNHEDHVRSTQNCTEGLNTWYRCNTTEHRWSELQAICTNSPDISTTAALQIPECETGAGTLVGVFIAGVIAAIVVMVLVLGYTRKCKYNCKKKSEGFIMKDTEHFEEERTFDGILQQD